MKKYFSAYIKEKKNYILKLTILIVVLSLSFSIRFVSTNNISEELFNKGLKEISIRNNHLFSESNKKPYKNFFFTNYKEETKSLFNEFITRLDDLIACEEVEYGYYSLCSSVIQDSLAGNVVGVSGEDFYKYNGVKIIDGRLPTKEEELNNYAVIYDGSINPSTNKLVKVGDTIKVKIYEMEKNYEVIGVYCVEYKYDYDVGTNDIFINNHLTMIPKNNYLKLIEEYNNFSYEAITVNKIVVGSSNYNDFNNLKEKVDRFGIDFKEYCKIKTMTTNSRNEIEFCDSNINTNVFQIEALNKAVENMRNMYILIGGCCGIVAIMNFITLLAYIIQNEKKDFVILQSLGMRKNDVIKSYIMIVLYNSFFPYVMGIIISYYIQQILTVRIKELANLYFVELMTYGALTIREKFELSLPVNLLDLKTILLTAIIILIIELAITYRCISRCLKEERK